MRDNNVNSDRQPAVAGQFYPANAAELDQKLSVLFAHVVPSQYEHVRAIISPHAGYVFSGEIAASAFSQIDSNKKYKHVFILASSHHFHFEGATVFCEGDFLMPYGKEKVDTVFGKNLAKEHPEIFSNDAIPHQKEHSIEVQLPFLYYVLKGDYSIIPIILGTSNPVVCKKIATVLKPYLNTENLFIISTDFSHYPDYEDANKIDTLTEKAIMTNNPEQLLKTLTENASKKIPGLLTSLCGWTSVLTLLYMTENDKSFRYNGIKFANSGDVKDYGEKNQVVGYRAIALTENKTSQYEFFLSEMEKRHLLQEARYTIENMFRKSEIHQPENLSDTLKARCGAFVTLHEHKKLRGCIGMIVSDKPLIETIREMAVSAAKHDHRFMPLTENELDEINIEISVLSPLKKISDISEIKLGVHGIFIMKESSTGVFLPQVATETGWNLEDFLGHCARDKAGIGWYGWKNGDIYTFTATIFREEE